MVTIMDEKKPLSKKSDLKTILLFVLIGLAFAALVLSARGSLRPIFIGCALAALMKSMCNMFYGYMEKLAQKKWQLTDKLRRLFHILSILATYIVWFFILYLFVALVVPRFGTALNSMVKSLPGFITSCITSIETFITEHPLLSEYSEQILETALDKLGTWASTDLTKALGNIANILISGISGTVGIIFDSTLGIIVSFYLLAGRKKLAAQLKLTLYAMLGKDRARPVIDELKFANKMFSGYFMGSLIDSSIVAIICYIGTLIFGIPYGVLVAVIVGVTNVIPFFGPYIGLIPSAIIILTVSPAKALIFVIMMIILQQIDGNIICPRIVGNTTGLSAFWVLFAILTFGGIFGFIGMLIGVPVFAVIYDIVEKVIRNSLRLRGEDDAEAAYDLEYPKVDEEGMKSKSEKKNVFLQINLRITAFMLSFKKQKDIKNATQSSNKEAVSDAEIGGNTEKADDTETVDKENDPNGSVQ